VSNGIVESCHEPVLSATDGTTVSGEKKETRLPRVEQTMAKILLVNFDREQAVSLAGFLRLQRHESWIAEHDWPLSHVVRSFGGTDLVIVDISHREQYARNLLIQIANYRAMHGPRPMALYISRVYRGPQFELEIERKGARFLYV
jgi:hypothetical protein